MASQLSDILDLVACVQESARRGDWKSAGELAAGLRRQTLPRSGEELGEYLFRLKEALVTAKVSRAHAAASLARINTAAARLKAATDFNNSRADLARADFAPARQKFGEAAEF